MDRPDLVYSVPLCMYQKASKEDTLFAETLKASEAVQAYIAFHERPAPDQQVIEEISTILMCGDGLNGHPKIMHGGLVATILDESMSVLKQVQRGLPSGTPGSGFTAELKIKYLKPISTPGVVLTTCKYIKRDGRKEWVYAEMKQRETSENGVDGKEIVCATAEGLFIEPSVEHAKL